MNEFRLSVCLLLALAVSASIAVAAEPTFPKEKQGDWHVLMGVPASQLGIKDKDTGLIGGKVKIEADRLTLASPGEKSEPLLVADCKVLAEQRVDEKKRALPGREAEAKLSGKVTGERRLIWAAQRRPDAA